MKIMNSHLQSLFYGVPFLVLSAAMKTGIIELLICIGSSMTMIYSHFQSFALKLSLEKSECEDVRRCDGHVADVPPQHPSRESHNISLLIGPNLPRPRQYCIKGEFIHRKITVRKILLWKIPKECNGISRLALIR